MDGVVLRIGQQRHELRSLKLEFGQDQVMIAVPCEGISELAELSELAKSRGSRLMVTIGLEAPDGG